MELLPFVCIYPYRDEIHEIVIYAHCWADAHAYAWAHKLIVKKKLTLSCNTL